MTRTHCKGREKHQQGRASERESRTKRRLTGSGASLSARKLSIEVRNGWSAISGLLLSAVRCKRSASLSAGGRARVSWASAQETSEGEDAPTKTCACAWRASRKLKCEISSTSSLHLIAGDEARRVEREERELRGDGRAGAGRAARIRGDSEGADERASAVPSAQPSHSETSCEKRATSTEPRRRGPCAPPPPPPPLRARPTHLEA